MKAITILIGAPVLLLALAACGGGSSVQTPPASATHGDPPPAAQPKEPATKPAPEPGERYVWVLMDTSMGDIVLQLDQKRAPVSVENFLAYAEAGFYEGTIFHRVMPEFVIQGGGFTPDMQKKPTRSPIVNEWRNGLKNLRGTISMARTRAPDSATSQFFISVNDNAGLDTARRETGNAAYAVFGHAVAGMDVVDRIRRVRTETVPNPVSPAAPPMANVPVEPVLIEKVSQLTPEEAQRRIAEGVSSG